MPKQRSTTKRLIGGMLFGSALAWLFGMGYAERYAEGERLWLFGATHDAGKVQRGSVLTHSVWVFNPTAKALELSSEPTCGCTTAEIPPRLLPMTGFRLWVRVDTQKSPVGRQEQRVYLIVRDGRYSWRESVSVRYEVVEVSKTTNPQIQGGES